MNNAPKWFVPVAVVAFIWNLLGLTAFVFDLMMTPEAIAQLSPAEQAIYAARPGWSVIATGVAVIFGTLGCLGLVLKKRWSFPLLVLSLVGVIVQDISIFLLGGILATVGATVLVIQGIVLVVSVLLVLMSRQGIKQGWLR